MNSLASGKMSRIDTCGFRQFKRLPPEIRYEIWLTALTTWSVAVYTNTTCVVANTSHPFHWNASTIGLVCCEARTIMKRVCTKLHQVPGRVGHCVWAHFETTVFFLGTAAEARSTISLFDTPLYSGLAHVAIVWTSWADVVGCFKNLSQNCSSLASILIFDAGKPYIPDASPLKPGSAHQMIAACKGIGRNYEPWWVDVPFLTEDLQSWFRPWPRQPAVIFLPL